VRAEELLPVMVVPAVVVALVELDRWPLEEQASVRAAWQQQLLRLLDGSGDTMADWLHGHAKRRPTRRDRQQVSDAFAVLARGLAAMAHQPGGVRFAGTLWCAQHAPLGTTGYPCPGCTEPTPGDLR